MVGVLHVSFELPKLYQLSDFELFLKHKKDVYSTGTGVTYCVIFCMLVFGIIVT
jgi:hypothetical protein